MDALFIIEIYFNTTREDVNKVLKDLMEDVKHCHYPAGHPSPLYQETPLPPPRNDPVVIPIMKHESPKKKRKPSPIKYPEMPNRYRLDQIPGLDHLDHLDLAAGNDLRDKLIKRKRDRNQSRNSETHPRFQNDRGRVHDRLTNPRPWKAWREGQTPNCPEYPIDNFLVDDDDDEDELGKTESSENEDNK